jgi:hypothetical protein
MKKKKSNQYGKDPSFYNIYNIYIIMNMCDSYIPHFEQEQINEKEWCSRNWNTIEFCVTPRITINKILLVRQLKIYIYNDHENNKVLLTKKY